LGCSKKESSSSASTGGGPLTLRATWIGQGQDRDLLEKIFAKYTAEKKINIECVFVPGNWAEYFTKIQTMIAGGETIDVCNVAIEGFEILVQTGMAAPIDNWIKANQAEWDAVTKDISPNVMDFMKFRGQQYGAPNEWNNVVTHMNMNLFQEAGLALPPPNWTKEQFLDYVQKLTKKRADGTTQYGVFVPNYYFGFEAWLYNNNAAYMTEDFKKSRLLEPNTVEMFQFVQDLVYKYQVAPIPEAGLDTNQLFMDGNVAMHFAGRWPTSVYYNNNFRAVSVQYVPNFKNNVVIWGGTAVFTMKASKHFNEAASFALYLASAPFIEEFMQYGAIPVLNSVASKLVPALGIPQNAGIYIESAALSKAVQSPAQYAECAQLIERCLSDILVNKQDVMATLRAADAELNLILADN
jgi:ABC-type glycerol-3-phosphate transport system substrate-binding protein